MRSNAPAACLPSDPEWAEGQLQKSAAYLQLGLPLQAMSALDDVSERQVHGLAAENFAEFIAAKADCMAWLDDRSGQVPELLRQARVRLQDLGLDEPSAAPAALDPGGARAWTCASSTISPSSGISSP